APHVDAEQACKQAAHCTGDACTDERSAEAQVDAVDRRFCNAAKCRKCTRITEFLDIRFFGFHRDPQRGTGLPHYGRTDHCGQIAVAQSRKVIQDRKSTRLNSSHVSISYAVFCLKKKNKTHTCNTI